MICTFEDAFAPGATFEASATVTGLPPDVLWGVKAHVSSASGRIFNGLEAALMRADSYAVDGALELRLYARGVDTSLWAQAGAGGLRISFAFYNREGADPVIVGGPATLSLNLDAAV